MVLANIRREEVCKESIFGIFLKTRTRGFFRQDAFMIRKSRKRSIIFIWLAAIAEIQGKWEGRIYMMKKAEFRK